MQHNYEKIKVVLSKEKDKKGEEPKINWRLEVLKKGKTKFEELISWFSKESEFQDVNLLVKMLREPAHSVLHMKSEKEGLKQFSIFRVKELGNTACEVELDPEVESLLASLPDFNENETQGSPA